MLALMIKSARRLLLALLCALPVASWATDDVLTAAIKKINGNVVFMRHAIAPGYGDPDNFKIGDCSTQRNLDDTGRSQARAIGKALSQSRTQFAEILSSEWCRCQETTALLGLGKWRTFEGLNSFFQSYADADATIPKLQKKLATLKPGVTLMVSHQVVISRITGVSPSSGGLVVYNTQTKQTTRVTLN
ncbi:MAG: histidine phosphatase family protein [Burkholderiaceae bacterium]